MKPSFPICLHGDVAIPASKCRVHGRTWDTTTSLFALFGIVGLLSAVVFALQMAGAIK